MVRRALPRAHGQTTTGASRVTDRPPAALAQELALDTIARKRSRCEAEAVHMTTRARDTARSARRGSASQTERSVRECGWWFFRRGRIETWGGPPPSLIASSSADWGAAGTVELVGEHDLAKIGPRRSSNTLPCWSETERAMSDGRRSLVNWSGGTCRRAPPTARAPAWSANPGMFRDQEVAADSRVTVAARIASACHAPRCRIASRACAPRRYRWTDRGAAAGRRTAADTGTARHGRGEYSPKSRGSPIDREGDLTAPSSRKSRLDSPLRASRRADFLYWKSTHAAKGPRGSIDTSVAHLVIVNLERRFSGARVSRAGTAAPEQRRQISGAGGG